MEGSQSVPRCGLRPEDANGTGEKTIYAGDASQAFEEAEPFTFLPVA